MKFILRIFRAIYKVFYEREILNEKKTKDRYIYQIVRPRNKSRFINELDAYLRGYTRGFSHGINFRKIKAKIKGKLD